MEDGRIIFRVLRRTDLTTPWVYSVAARKGTPIPDHRELLLETDNEVEAAQKVARMRNGEAS